MSQIRIQLKGISAELVLGNYMPTDTTIMNDWQEFYHCNDLIHVSHLLTDYIQEIKISEDDKIIYSGSINTQTKPQKSFMPFLVDRALYLRTECAEDAIYETEFEVDEFDMSKLTFETQDFDLLFKVGTSFLSQILYDGKLLELSWQKGKPVGNICLLCRFEKGFLVPLYDAVSKIESKNK